MWTVGGGATYFEQPADDGEDDDGEDGHDDANPVSQSAVLLCSMGGWEASRTNSRR